MAHNMDEEKSLHESSTEENSAQRHNHGNGSCAHHDKNHDECCGHHGHDHGECCGHHGNDHDGCCGHHGHGGCNHAKDQIGIFKVSPLATNCYIYVSGDECMIVDPGASGAEIAAQLMNLKLKYIVATHGHADHVGGVKALKLAVPTARYLISQADNTLAHEAHTKGEMYDDAPDPDGFLHEGDELTVGTAKFRVMETPGHTPGGLVLVGSGTALGVVFVGDTLFKGSAGRTDLPGGDFEQLQASLERIKVEIDPTSIILSGHGDQTALEIELETNPFFK